MSQWNVYAKNGLTRTWESKCWRRWLNAICPYCVRCTLWSCWHCKSSSWKLALRIQNLHRQGNKSNLPYLASSPIPASFPGSRKQVPNWDISLANATDILSSTMEPAPPTNRQSQNVTSNLPVLPRKLPTEYWCSDVLMAKAWRVAFIAIKYLRLHHGTRRQRWQWWQNPQWRDSFNNANFATKLWHCLLIVSI